MLATVAPVALALLLPFVTEPHAWSRADARQSFAPSMLAQPEEHATFPPEAPSEAPVDVLASLREQVLLAEQGEGEFPQKEVFGAHLSACASSGDWETACSLLDLMPSALVAVEGAHYTSAIRACRRAGEWRCAMTLLQDARSLGLKFNHFAYSHVVDSCDAAGQGEEAMQAYVLGVQDGAICHWNEEEPFSIDLHGFSERTVRRDPRAGALSPLRATAHPPRPPHHPPPPCTGGRRRALRAAARARQLHSRGSQDHHRSGCAEFDCAAIAPASLLAPPHASLARHEQTGSDVYAPPPHTRRAPLGGRPARAAPHSAVA